MNRARFIFIMLLLAATAGLSFQTIGLVYLLDAISLLLAAVAALHVIYWRRKLWILALFLFPLAALTVDIHNAVPLDDILRGIFRNTVFVAAVTASYYWSRRFSLRMVIPLIYGCYFSFAWIYLVTGGVLGMRYSNYVKFGYGFFLIAPVVWQFRRVPFLVEFTLGAAGVILITAMDCRSMGAACLLGGGISVVRRVSMASLPIRLVLCGALFAALVAVSPMLVAHAQQAALENERRRADADNERLDMAKDAWSGFIGSPWVGNGTWQHARRYVSAVDNNLTVGVHSWLIQLAFEYGVLGLMFGAAIVVVIVAGLLSLYFRCNAAYHPAWSIFPFTALLLVLSGYYVIMGPFNGPSRCFEGISIGVAMALAFDFDRAFRPRDQKH